MQVTGYSRTLKPTCSASSRSFAAASPSSTLRSSGQTLADYESVLAPHYWEVGASGRRYSREFILCTLSDPVDAASVGWPSHDHGFCRLSPDTYLLTYTLRQGPRLTRRATIWQNTSEAGASSTIKARSSRPTRMMLSPRVPRQSKQYRSIHGRIMCRLASSGVFSSWRKPPNTNCI